MKKLFSLLTLALLTLSAWAGTPVTDVITASNLAATGTSYVDFSNVTITSNAVYAGQSAKNSTGAIQLRSKNSNSGIVSTASGGKLVSIKIDVESGTNTIEVYGNTNAYTSAAELYDTAGNDNQGTKLGELTDDGTITVEGDYQFVGIRSKNGAVYISSIEITWESEGGVTPPDPTYTEVANLAAANGLDDNTDFQFKGDAVVTYQYGKYLYLRDGSGYGLIYNKTANIEPTFTPGDVLAQNWTAKKTTYDGYAEYTDYSTLSANGTDATLAAPQVITALDSTLINAYVQINNVVSISGTTATLADGTTITLYKRFDATIPAFEDGNYYIRGIVSQHNNNLQLLFTGSNYETPAATTVANIDEAKQVTPGNQFIFSGNAVVAYKHGKNLWLRDATGSALAYNETDSTIVQGTVIAPNWGATVATYQNMPEFTELTDFNANGTQEVLPLERQTLTMDNYAEYVIVKGLKFVSTNVSGGHTNYVTEDGLTVRDNYDLFTYDENATYNITGIVSAFSNTPQLYITSYEAIVGVAMPVITPNGGVFNDDVEVTITCATEGAEIIYTINNGDEITYNGPFTLTESATIKAYAQTDDAESTMAEATFTIVKVEEATYALVTDVTNLADGDKIIIVNTNEAGEAYAMGAANTNYFGLAPVTISETITITTADANVITLNAKDNNWTLKANEGYLYASSSSSNYLNAKADIENDSNAIAAITINDSITSIIFQGSHTRNDLRYNASASRFSCYGSNTTQAHVYIYKQVQDQPEVKLGDVNKDGVVRIDDVTALIDALLSGNTDVETEYYSPANADVNQDTFIRIDDVTALIDMLLSGAAN